MVDDSVSSDRRTTIKSYFPILDWLPNYDRNWLRPDVIAAFTVWALLIPEAMAYATMAGLPPEAGLYAAPFALLGYAIFGTSRQLVVGPSSTVAAMSLVVVSLVAVQGTEKFIALSAVLAILVGVLFVASGLFKLGFLANFMSRPVLSGLVVGIAITIAIGQLDKMLGYSVEQGGFLEELYFFFRDIQNIHVLTLIVSIVSLILLFGIEEISPKIPAALVVVLLGIVLSALLNLEERGVHVVGDIPAGLPTLGFPDGIELRDILALLPGAIGILLVAFAESLAAARSYAGKHNYEIDPDQEMVGMGVANIGAGFSQGFVVDGSLSRTAAADQAGQKSQLASIINAGLVLVTAALLTPLFRTLPEAVLGAIVFHAVWHLISFKELRRLYGIRKADFWTAVLALVGVLFMGILAGLALAVLLSFLALLARASRPSTAILGLVPGEEQDVFGNIAHFSEAETIPGLIIFRFDQQLFFANAAVFLEHVRSAVRSSDPKTKVVMVDAEAITDIDSSATDMLNDLADELNRMGVALWFARIRAEIYDVMELAGLIEKVGKDHFHRSIRAGVQAFQQLDKEEKDQPLPVENDTDQ
jgi:high affinity sulfate transporter 1